MKKFITFIGILFIWVLGTFLSIQAMYVFPMKVLVVVDSSYLMKQYHHETVRILYDMHQDKTISVSLGTDKHFHGEYTPESLSKTLSINFGTFRPHTLSIYENFSGEKYLITNMKNTHISDYNVIIVP